MSDRFEIKPTSLSELTVISRKPRGDGRGYLERMFCTEELRSVLGGRQVVQINHTLTQLKGTVRGLHFQYSPHAEMKLVSCLRGAVFDVAVDLRKGSPTFLGWHAELLSADNFRTFVIPEGFAHGFQTLTDDCEMLYLHTAAYVPGAESGLNPRDPSLDISWPLPIADMSQRDTGHLPVDSVFEGVSL